MLERQDEAGCKTRHLPLFRASLLFAGYLLVSLFVLAVAGNDRPNASQPGPAEAGKDIWQGNNCISCHAIMGLGGHLGPDLTNAYSRRGEGYIRYVLANGSGKMPAFALSDAEQYALIAYLKEIDGTTVYPIKSLDGPVFGRPPAGVYGR